MLYKRSFIAHKASFVIHMCLVIDVPSDDVRRASNLICKRLLFSYGSEIPLILIAGESPDISITESLHIRHYKQHNPFCLQSFRENKISIVSCNKIMRNLDEHSIQDTSFLVEIDFKIFLDDMLKAFYWCTIINLNYTPGASTKVANPD